MEVVEEWNFVLWGRFGGVSMGEVWENARFLDASDAQCLFHRFASRTAATQNFLQDDGLLLARFL